MISAEKWLSFDTHQVFLFLCVLQQLAYGIDSRTLFSSTYSTQHRELLITFHNGNSAQTSSIEKQYGIQKVTNFWVINMTVLLVGACIDFV